MNVPARVSVIGSQVSACDMHTALGLVESRVQDGGGGYVCFTNVHTTVQGRRDRSFREITNSSFLSVADGKPIYWTARAKSRTTVGHVPGPDFFSRTLQLLPHHRHFFYGSTPQVLSQLVSRLKLKIPALQVCGTLSPPFRPLTAEDKQHHYETIRASGADLVWVGLGAPKQEQWMAEAWQHLKPAVLFGVGAAFDFHAGTVRRAPSLLGYLGLEWLYRLLQEPRRLGRRYLVTNCLFLAYTLEDMLKADPPRGQES
jgi:N-acetylglucosaminyldiphosphoundecaprenol N-acetyl-beta-D-mannosaminyltransferase